MKESQQFFIVSVIFGTILAILVMLLVLPTDDSSTEKFALVGLFCIIGSGIIIAKFWKEGSFVRTRKIEGPFYAVRGWSVRDTLVGHQLYGIKKKIWHRGQLYAECLVTMHEAPEYTCGCGIYCYKDAKSWIRGDYYNLPIWGIVELSGTIIEHENGYRAQHAKIVALYYNQDFMNPPDSSYRFNEEIVISFTKEIHLDFDVPIFTSFKHMCSEYGLDVGENVH